MGYWCKDAEKAHESMLLSLEKHTASCQVVFWVAGKLKNVFTEHTRHELINSAYKCQQIIWLIHFEIGTDPAHWKHLIIKVDHWFQCLMYLCIAHAPKDLFQVIIRKVLCNIQAGKLPPTELPTVLSVAPVGTLNFSSQSCPTPASLWKPGWKLQATWKKVKLPTVRCSVCMNLFMD